MFFEITLGGAISACIVGLIFTAVGWRLLDEVRAYRRHGTLRDAHVSSVRERRARRRNSVTYEPVFAFTDETGTPVERPSFVASTAYNFPIGSPHRILTLPDRDAVLMADGWGGRAMSLGFLGMGLIALAMGVQGLAGHLGA